MTDNELLLAISEILDPIRDDIREIKKEVKEVKKEVDEVKLRVKKMELKQETDIIPPLNNIQYLSQIHNIRQCYHHCHALPTN